MNLSHCLEKIETSQQFKNFLEKNPEAKLCAGFFVLDFKEFKDQSQIDYCTPDGDIFTFTLNNEITLTKPEMIEEEKKLSPLDREKIKIELQSLKRIVESEMEKNKVSSNLEKIIAIIQNFELKDKPTSLIWNLTCMLPGLKIIQVWIDAFSGEILKFEDKSLFDVIKKVK